MYQRVQPDAKQYTSAFQYFIATIFALVFVARFHHCSRGWLHVILRVALASKALNATCHTTVHQSETGVRTQLTAHIGKRLAHAKMAIAPG
jgi:hypothetical protein